MLLMATRGGRVVDYSFSRKYATGRVDMDNLLRQAGRSVKGFNVLWFFFLRAVSVLFESLRLGKSSRT